MKKTLLLWPSFLCSVLALTARGQACANCSGVNQSPVEIVNAFSISAPLNVVVSSSQEALETVYAYDAATKMPNNIEVEPGGHHSSYTVTLNGITYRFNNVHFHLPSEHKVHGRFYQMEAHFVFKSDVASQGAVVIGMLIGRAGMHQVANPILDSLVQGIHNTAQALPDTASYHFSSQVNPNRFNLATLLRGEYYSYTGSLTVPYFAEGLTWLVLSNPQFIGPRYFDMFATIQAKYNFGAARPLQPINNRVILQAPARK